MDYCGKSTVVKMCFFQTKKQYEVKSVEVNRLKSNGSELINQYPARRINQSIINESIYQQSTPRYKSNYRRLPVRYNCPFVCNAYS